MNSIQDQQFKLLLVNVLPLNENSKQALVVQREVDLLHSISKVLNLFFFFHFYYCYI